MRLNTKMVGIAALTSAVLAVFGTSCSKSSSSGSGTTYASTSTQGDYAQWTFDGGNLTGTWEVTDSSGAVAETLTVAASCGDADSTYGYRTCNVTSASCANGTQVCGGSDAPTVGAGFYAFEVPGVALFVQGTGGGHSQLHVGLALDTSCGDVSGDYTYMHIGNDQSGLFGVYRVNADMSSVNHADFRMNVASGCTIGTTPSGSCTVTPTIAYDTNGGSGTGAESVLSNGCTSGVRALSFASGTTVRVSASQSGAFILDLPSGQGGILSFKTTNAATIGDFAGKSFGGIVFPDNGSPELMTLGSGSLSSGTVGINNLQFNNGTPGVTNGYFVPAVGSTSTASSPAYPNFTAAFNPAGNYSSNVLSSTYASASAIPGLFYVDGTFSDTGRVLIAAMKYNDKVIGFGSVYNWRQTHGYVNSGAFILFEK